MKKLLIFLFITTATTTAQTVYEPLHRDISEYLGRLAQKGVIEFNDEIKPVSRGYIAELLMVADSLNHKLTTLEKNELEFYKKDFGIELSSLHTTYYLLPTEIDSIQKEVSSKTTIAGKDPYGRYRLFSYEDNLFQISARPILGYELGSKDGESYSHRWNGVGLYGYINRSIGFSFDFRDNRETGLYDAQKRFTPSTGISGIGYNNGLEYSEIRTHLTYSWDWGHFALGKEFIEWGYGESGKLVLSQKSPSFPFLKYDVSPVKWLQFNFFHAWLSSDVVDSNEIYNTGSVIGGTHRILFREKYLASHTLTIKPTSGLSFSLGESIIYSDRFEPIYLLPLIFFRAADHYLSRQNNSAGGNSQFFLGISSRNHIKNTHLFGTAFIDEIRTDEIGDPGQEKNQVGFMLGGSVVDLPINNLKLTVEYSKIYPFVYMHYIQTQTYANALYNIGHWMGSNADLVYAALNYKIIRGLNTNIWVQAIRKGEEGNPEMQHTMPQAPFLFGLRKNYIDAGAEVKYELTHELFLKGRFVYNHTEVQQPDRVFVKDSFKEFYLALYYGL